MSVEVVAGMQASKRKGGGRIIGLCANEIWASAAVKR
jgi:hypothetical protein